MGGSGPPSVAEPQHQGLRMCCQSRRPNCLAVAVSKRSLGQKVRALRGMLLLVRCQAAPLGAALLRLTNWLPVLQPTIRGGRWQLPRHAAANQRSATSWHRPCSGNLPTREALKHLSMPSDAIADQSFFTVIDAFQGDAFAGSLRAERAIQADNPGRQSLGLLCDAHKKAAVASLTFEVAAPSDPCLIRLALACQRANLQTIWREIRATLQEHLVVIKPGHCPADAAWLRLDMCNMHIGGMPCLRNQPHR